MTKDVEFLLRSRVREVEDVRDCHNDHKSRQSHKLSKHYLGWFQSNGEMFPYFGAKTSREQAKK